MNTYTHHHYTASKFLTLIAALSIVALLASMLQITTVHAYSPDGRAFLINTESFDTIDSGDLSSNIELRFGDSTRTLLYDVTLAAFVFTGNVYVRGTLSGNILHAEQGLTSSGVTRLLGNTSIGATGFTGETNLDVLGGISGSRLTISGPAGFSGAVWLGKASAAVGGDLRIVGAGGNNYAKISGAASARTEVDYVGGAAGIWNWNTDWKVGIGTSAPDTTLDVVGTISGSYLQIAQTASGRNLFATQSITGSHLNAALTFGGAGLTDCDGSTQKIIWNDATKQFGCGTDQSGGAWSGTGALQTYFDNRFVNRSGDNMTGALTIDIQGGTLSTVGLNVINTISGAIIRAQKELHSSGAIVTESGAYIAGTSLVVQANNGRVGIGTATPAQELTVNGGIQVGPTANTSPYIFPFLGSSYTSEDKTGRGLTFYNYNTSHVNTYGTVVTGETMTATSGFQTNFFFRRTFAPTSGTATFSNQEANTTINQTGGASGITRDLYFNPSLTAAADYRAIEVNLGSTNHYGIYQAGTNARNLFQGTITGAGLEVTGVASGTNIFATQSITGSHLNASLTFGGAGLTDCDGSTQKIIWNDATKRFGCGTDQTGSSNWSGTGALQTYFDDRFVNRSGDNMTGALTINIQGGTLSTVGLNVINTISGAIIRAQKELHSSGAIVTESGAYIAGTSLVVQANNGRVGIGTAEPKAKFDVVGTISGTTLTVSRNGSFSGAVNAVGNILSRATISGAVIRSDNHNPTNNNAIFGTFGIQSTGVNNGFLQDNTYWDGANFRYRASGFGSMFQFFNGELYFRRFASGTAGNTATALESMHIGTNGNVGIGTITAKAKLDVIGTISGSQLMISRTASGRDLFATRSITGSHLHASLTFGGAGLTDCDGTTQKIIWNDATKQFGCGTDQTGAGGNWSNTGSLQSYFDNRYVNTSGDTMTGMLTVDLLNTGAGTGLLLRERAYLGSGATLSGALVLQSITPNQAAPISNNLKSYSTNVAARPMQTDRGPSGAEYQVQPGLFNKLIMMLSTGGGTTVNGYGTTVTNDTTVSHPTPTETFGYMTNFATAATTNDTAGTSSVNTTWFRGSTTGANGFFFKARVGVVDTTSIRVFTGLINQTIATAVAGDNPTGHLIGFQFSTNRADTNWQFTTKDNTTQNVVNTGIAFTANKVYDLTFYCTAQCTSVTWQINNVTDGTVATGSTSSNLPGGSTALRMVHGLATLTTTAKNYRMQSIYSEADR